MNIAYLKEKRKCPITKEKVLNLQTTNGIYYKLEIKDKTYSLRFCESCFEKINFKKYRSTIFGLILNEKIDINDRNLIIHWDKKGDDFFDLKQFITESYYPRTPKEKYDNLISELFKRQSAIGHNIAYLNLKNDMLIEKSYFDSSGEFLKYINALEEEKLINCNYSSGKSLDSLILNITFKGFTYLDQLEKTGSESKNCFIAMAFKNETVPAREAIKNAIIKTGFIPIIIDEQNIDSDQTINDAIIAGIKKSKFCISDFSFHRNGVYFESGYALGLGKPVIYCCSKEEFKNAHFDIKPLQHIIYDSPEQLEKNLIHKIEAWIK